MGFELVRDRHGGVLVLTPRGRLDNENAAEFELAAQELLDAGERHVVVNLAELNYASNAGLRVLGKMGKALKAPDTSLRLCGLTPALRQVFDAAGIASLFDVRLDLKAALADHPAARGAGELGIAAAQLLGARAANGAEPASDAIKQLAQLARELLAIGAPASKRAARPMVDATALVPKVRDADVARVRAAEAAQAAQRPWWKRLFGGKKT